MKETVTDMNDETKTEIGAGARRPNKGAELIIAIVVGIGLVGGWVGISGGWSAPSAAGGRASLCAAAADLKQSLYFSPGSSLSYVVEGNKPKIMGDLTTISQNSKDPRVAGAFYQLVTTVMGMTGNPRTDKAGWRMTMVNDPMGLYAADQLSSAFNMAKGELAACGAKSPANWSVSFSQ